MQKAKLEIFVQCLTKTLVQFLLQAACRLSHRWEEKCWDLLHTLAFYHQACPKPTNLGTKVGAAQCLYYMFRSEADHLELVFSLPVSPWPMTGSHSSCPRTYSLHSLEIWFMVLDSQQHVYVAQSTCLGHLLPAWQDVRERLGELQWKHWEHSREGES